MKVRMTNDLFIKMLLDVQMYPFWFVSQKRTCLGTLAIRGVTFIECGMRSLYMYQIGTMPVRDSYQSIPELPAYV